jgi:DNA-directed RNA polymerase I subunit RPA2
MSTIDVTTQGTTPVLGPNGEFCRVCRAEDEVRRQQGLEPLRGKRQPIGGAEATIGIPAHNVINNVTGGDLDVVAVPYVLKYLVAELAAMGIKMSFALSP